MAQQPWVEAEVELLEAVTAELQIRMIELGPLIESVLAGLPARQRTRVDYTSARRITVLGDHARLRFALVTLLKMILTCSPPYSRIKVSAVENGSRATLSVSAAAQPRKPHSIAVEIARRVAEAHGGSIAASTFAEHITWYVELPASSRVTRRWPARSGVLLVDDDHDQVHALAEVLRIEGLTIECATSGREAIERLAVRVPDFLIVDLQLPDYSGAEVIAHARSLRPRVPAALLTGYPPDHPMITRAIAATQSEYLGKPVNLDALLDLVANALR
jgi:CheY-like chemotaxis protein